MKYWYKVCLINRKWIMDVKDKLDNVIFVWLILIII